MQPFQFKPPLPRFEVYPLHVCVCRPAPPVSRQEDHPCSHGGAITLLKKVKKKKKKADSPSYVLPRI